ncbi:MAG TPA: ankyrin repeat domain-containing protein [Planctomycetota bacterium]|nr:ankyrin repeat domain-containing protein [Planctomycetota bacterium]
MSRSPGDAELMDLLRSIVKGDGREAARRIAAFPALARLQARAGATRSSSTPFFFDEIKHYVYAGDTALHLAAAAHQHEIARRLLDRGADVASRNRRGAEPLHYAADGGPFRPDWSPAAQAETIRGLLDAGANPDALDKSGVAPLHRAVRGRCTPAVEALLDRGAHARLRNKSGSTPLHLAVQTTGASGSGSPEAAAEQKTILRLLLKHGADPKEKDAAGKTAVERAAQDWMREILAGPRG